MGSFEDNYIPTRNDNWYPPVDNKPKKSIETVKEKETEKIIIDLLKFKKGSEFRYPSKDTSEYYLDFATEGMVMGTIKPLKNLPAKMETETEEDYKVRLSQNNEVIKAVKEICLDYGASADLIFGKGEGKKTFFDYNKIVKEDTSEKMAENINRE